MSNPVSVTNTPAPPPENPNGPLPKVPTASPTARVSNPLFDVVHFTMSLDVEAEKIPLFLRTLSKNRFITAYQVDLKVVDGAERSALGLRYGDKPVVTLNLQCEELFFRQWLTPLMPQNIKKQLNIQPTPAVADAR
jgi:hypothetical protein